MTTWRGFKHCKRFSGWKHWMKPMWKTSYPLVSKWLENFCAKKKPYPKVVFVCLLCIVSWKPWQKTKLQCNHWCGDVGILGATKNSHLMIDTFNGRQGLKAMADHLCFRGWGCNLDMFAWWIFAFLTAVFIGFWYGEKLMGKSEQPTHSGFNSRKPTLKTPQTFRFCILFDLPSSSGIVMTHPPFEDSHTVGRFAR